PSPGSRDMAPPLKAPRPGAPKPPPLSAIAPPPPPQRSIHSPISLSKHAHRCQLAASVVYDRGSALRYSPRDGLALDALPQKGLATARNAMSEIRIARSRSMGENRMTVRRTLLACLAIIGGASAAYAQEVTVKVGAV